jgi:CubicO group peptidase (beta-lactamase class C family)
MFGVKPLSCLALLSALAIAHADPIDDFIKAEMIRTKSPSIALGIIKDGKLVKHEVYGKANLELDSELKKGDLFEIGSITKQFTSVATLLLVEDGKIGLDDPISKYLEGSPKSWEGIKVRNLLYQTSGLPDYAFEEGIGLVDTFDKQKWMDIMSKLPLDFQPGVAWSYSNSNYALLGWVIEKSAGMGYMTFMRERVFKPLGMDSTTFSDPYSIIPRRAAGYMVNQNSLLRAQFSSASINSDGTILSNVEDMAKWDAALRDRKLLKASSYDLLWKAATLNSGRWRPYGMGFNVALPGAEAYYGHGGNSSGYSAGYACYPKAKVSVIVMGNIYAFGGEPMAKQIAELYEPSLKPASPSAKPDPDAKRTDSIKQALLALGNAKADETLFEEEVLAPLKTRRGAAGAGGLAPLRTLETLEFAGELTVGKDKLLTYKISTKTRNFVGTILWSAGGKIAMTSLRPDGPVKA